MFEKYHLANSAHIITASVPGETSIFLRNRQKELEGNNVSYPKNIPIAFKSGKGSIVEDADENLYIDFLSGCGVFNLGHNNPDILEAVKRREGIITQTLDFPTQERILFLERLNEILPGSLKNKVKFNLGGPTGSDAVESAIKLARIVTGRYSIVAFRGGYHGMTEGALSVTSKLSHRKDAPPLVPGVHFMPYCSDYRCPLAVGGGSCGQRCIEYFKGCIESPHSGIDKPAAIIIEPIQGEGGTYIPPQGWLEKVVDVARENGILVIFDEVQTGFYRTGKLFSFEHTEAVPDIITMSKGLGGNGYPLSLIIYRDDLDVWSPGTHIGTFRGNQLAMVAGTAAIEFVRTNDVSTHVTVLGEKMLKILKDLQTAVPYIGDVRGIGMIFGIEYVKNRSSKEPFPDAARLVRKRCYESGLIVEIGGYYDNVIRFLPPLITTHEIAQNGLDIFKAAHKNLEGAIPSEDR